MVAAASLVATSGHPAQPKPTHFIYDLYDEIASVGQTILPPSRTFTARVSTPRLFASVSNQSTGAAFI